MRKRFVVLAADGLPVAEGDDANAMIRQAGELAEKTGRYHSVYDRTIMRTIWNSARG